MERKTYLIHDASLIVHHDRVPGDFMAVDEYLVNSVKRTMKKAGYSFRQDVTVAKCIRRNYFAGQKDDVHFVCQTNPTGLQFDFYEDVIRDNKCGGRYHFDKMVKMPYLRRLKVQLIHQKLAARLEILGYTDGTPVSHRSARAFVCQQRMDLIAFQGQRMYEEERQSYNDTDADGIRIKDGDLRYFRDRYDGHLNRGIAWHNINNMWWILCQEDEVHNVCCHDLFSYDAARHKRRDVPNALWIMERKLAQWVKAQNYEKAIGLRDAIRRRFPTPALAEVVPTS